jgi:hypothetical protein
MPALCGLGSEHSNHCPAGHPNCLAYAAGWFAGSMGWDPETNPNPGYMQGFDEGSRLASRRQEVK